MTLNEATGNMFQFIDATWNPIAGQCPHNCGYCYTNEGFYEEMDKYQGDPRLHEDSLNDDLSRYDSYFVGNMADMFAEQVPTKAIRKVLEHCRKWEDNTYLYLTKNPQRYFAFKDELPERSILGTTVETNRGYEDTEAPPIRERLQAMYYLPHDLPCPKMVSIEPIMDFDLGGMIETMTEINLEFVSIGADSKGHDLVEPSKEKVIGLIQTLQGYDIQTHLKPNLSRIIGEDEREMFHQPVGVEL